MNLKSRFPVLFPSLVTFAVLVGLPAVLSYDAIEPVDNESRIQLLRQTFASAPYRIGDWTGEDVAVPTAAIEMLRPTVILSRRYSHVREAREASVFIVRCSDARDMGSHYPPVCYPAQGWVEDGDGRRSELLVPYGTSTLPLRAYDFVRGNGVGESNQIRVLNCFVRSDGTVVADRLPVNYLLERRGLSAQGIAQIQVATSGDMSVRESVTIASELLEGHATLISLLSHEGDVP